MSEAIIAQYWTSYGVPNKGVQARILRAEMLRWRRCSFDKLADYYEYQGIYSLVAHKGKAVHPAGPKHI